MSYTNASCSHCVGRGTVTTQSVEGTVFFLIDGNLVESTSPSGKSAGMVAIASHREMGKSGLDLYTTTSLSRSPSSSVTHTEPATASPCIKSTHLSPSGPPSSIWAIQMSGTVGLSGVGSTDGYTVGVEVGPDVGVFDGVDVGDLDGPDVGLLVGLDVGPDVGDDVGVEVGPDVGEEVGELVGDEVG
jgi:hypothetical protein